MDRKAEINRILNHRFDKSPIQMYQAIVKSIQGLNCTVDIVGTDLEDVPDVNLRADDEAPEGVLIVPRVGSLVYIGALENTGDNLFVCMVSEVDRIEVTIGEMTLAVDKDHLEATIGDMALTADKDQVHAVRDKCELTLSDKAVLKQDQTVVELASGKVSIKNAGFSLKGLFDDLISLLQAFQVTCAAPGAPSAPFPATIAQVSQLATKVSQLFS